MKRLKTVLLGSAGMLALLLVFGCSLPAGDDPGTSEALGGKQWYIKLQIKAPARPREIAVVDYQVTGLRIKVRDPEERVLKTIVWAAKEGPQTCLIPVVRRGEYKVEVVHLGRRGEEVVEVPESIVFTIRAVCVTVVSVVPGCIGVIRVEDE